MKMIWRVRRGMIGRAMLLVVLAGGLVVGDGASARAQIPVVSQIVSTAVRAADLAVQRLQTETIVLQEAEQVLQNAMSQLRLEEIANWVYDQRSLYAEYFQELMEVKTVITDYHKVKEIIQRQQDIVTAYQLGLARFRQDKHFSAAELGEIESVYSGILTESGKNLAELVMVIQSLATQMTDRQRLAIIDGAAAGMDKNWRDLQVYTNANASLSLGRAQDENDYQFIKKMYGL
jgi:hypothetical protein